MPTDDPVTTPVAASTAAAGPLLLQVPPGTLLDNVVVNAVHTDKEPVIGDAGFTITSIVAKHPLADLYVSVAMPALTPVATPVSGFIEAIVASLDVHVPPAVSCVYMLIAPSHIVLDPAISGVSVQAGVQRYTWSATGAVVIKS